VKARPQPYSHCRACSIRSPTWPWMPYVSKSPPAAALTIQRPNLPTPTRSSPNLINAAPGPIRRERPRPLRSKQRDFRCIGGRPIGSSLATRLGATSTASARVHVRVPQVWSSPGAEWVRPKIAVRKTPIMDLPSSYGRVDYGKTTAPAGEGFPPVWRGAGTGRRTPGIP
jgi:hypothetical protein